MSVINTQDATWHIRILYGLPAMALAVPTVPVFIYLPTFYAKDVGLGLATTGAVLLIARIIDVVSDPLIGFLSDRLPLRFRGNLVYRRKPWISLGGLIAFISLIFLFNPSPGEHILYFLSWAIALYLGWTMISVPYAAWGAELSNRYHGRSKLTATREIFTLIGILISGGIMATGARLELEESLVLSLLSWVTGGIGLITLAVLLWFVPERSEEPKITCSLSASFKLFQKLIKNLPFLRLIGAWLLNGFANGLPAVIFLLYMEHGLGASSNEQATLIMIYFATAVLGIPVWITSAKHSSKHGTWCAAMIIACLAFMIVPFLSKGDIFAFGVVCVITGFALGADLYLPPAMQADVIDLDELRSGERNAGVYFALTSMATKLALGLAIGLAFPALDAAGFEPSSPSSSGIFVLIMIYSIIPIVFKTLAIMLVWKHPISEHKQGIIRRRLEKRKVSAKG